MSEIQRLLARAEVTGQSGYCLLHEHWLCHPQDVYVERPGRPPVGPIFSITCTCACHTGGSH